ncbi:MAG: methyltransferase domain-containing protein [Candidatus Omnitrophica bacterium]|nr:methyltransferase domain-containing protein [Candidatus Omnitrophota bacterium]
MRSVTKLILLARWLLFPGLDLHTRCRYRFLPQFFRSGPIDTLDAGCGNGALTYAAYKMGNHVLGVTYGPVETEKNLALFSFLKTDSSHLRFQTFNIYDLPKLGRQFDQIICSETLEHIRQDRVIVQHFYNLLRPAGILHLCCPYALHPEHHLGRVDNPEDGGHVRDGYTLESYRSLLEPVGFELVKSVGLGSPLLVQLDRPVRYLRNKGGDALAVPLFLMSWPLQFLDFLNPSIPFSLYVQAVKRSSCAKQD